MRTVSIEKSSASYKTEEHKHHKWIIMENPKAVDYRILRELIKNSRRSDRQLAKVLGISQPTVTRRRALVEKIMIEGYTAVPKWKNLGYEIFAITFVKIKAEIASRKEYEATRSRGLQWLMDHHNIIMGGGCRGIGVDSFMISIHKSYSDYDDFLKDYRLELGDFIDNAQSVLINLAGKELLKPLDFRYMAESE
jgi:DNA-binding Lrp family transcriptional regulator